MIYELNIDIENALEKYYNSQDLETWEIIDEEAFIEASKELEELQNKKDDLKEFILKSRANTLWQISWIDNEIKRLTELKETLNNKVKKSDFNLQRLFGDIDKVIFWNWKIWYRKSQAVKITDDFNHPDYMKEKIVITADKIKIKEDLNNWKIIDGASIEERKTFFIK